MGTRKMWTCWQGTQHWNAELPRKYVGTGTQFPADWLCKAWALLPLSAMRLWASSDKERISTALKKGEYIIIITIIIIVIITVSSDGIISANISRDRASLRRSSVGPPTVYRRPADNRTRPLPTRIRPSTARQPRRQRLVADDRQGGTGTYFARRRSSVLIHRCCGEDGVYSSTNRSTGAEWTSCLSW